MLISKLVLMSTMTKEPDMLSLQRCREIREEIIKLKNERSGPPEVSGERAKEIDRLIEQNIFHFKQIGCAGVDPNFNDIVSD